MTRPAFSPLMTRTPPPPVMEARRWVMGRTFPADMPLLNLSQAAPVDPPPRAFREAMAEMVLNEDDTHLYGPVLGLPGLRAEIAMQWSAAYGGVIGPEDVAITAGCNKAFCTVVTAIAEPGAAVMIPVPWYFNHKMWLDMMGIEAVPLPCGPGMLPDLRAAEALMHKGVRAIALVSPNNPTGAEYPAELVAGFAALARRHGAWLILDETYRDFDARSERPHDLFADPDWRDVLIHLYSFSKAFRLTGHRVGAIVAGPELLAEAEKFLDTVAICAPQLGQKAALWGLQNLGGWVAGERTEILRRREAAVEAFSGLPGWKLLGCGAYFAYVEHPFDIPSDAVAKAMVEERSVLVLPGTMFGPARAEGGDGGSERQLRVAFANADAHGLAELARRLHGWVPAGAAALASQDASA